MRGEGQLWARGTPAAGEGAEESEGEEGGGAGFGDGVWVENGEIGESQIVEADAGVLEIAEIEVHRAALGLGESDGQIKATAGGGLVLQILI